MWVWRASLTVIAAVVTAVLVVCFLASLEWVGRPFAGFLMGRNAIVAPIGLPDWSGFRAGVPFGARLVAVDGAPIESVPRLVEEVWRRPVGSERVYRFARFERFDIGEPQPPVERKIPVMSFSRADYALLFGPWVVNGLLFLGLGFLVAALKPGRPVAAATLVFGVAWGLTLLLSLGDFYRFHFRSLYAVAQAVAPAALVFFSLTFPDRDLPQRWRELLVVFVVATTLHAGADIWLYERDPHAWYRFFDWSLVYMAACALASCVLLGRWYRRAPQDGRVRLQLVAVGGFAALGAPAVIQLAAMASGVALPLNLLPGLTGLFALAVGYAILRHDVLSLDPLLSRSVFYALFSTAMTAAYIALLGLASAHSGAPFGVAAWIPFVFALSAVLVLAPLRRAAQAFVDRVFFRTRYDLEKTLEDVSESLTGSLDAAEIARRIETTLSATIAPDPCLLLLPDARGRLRDDIGVELADDELLDRLRSAPAAVVPLHDRLASPRLAGSGVVFFVPLRSDGHLEAVLALGPKRSGAGYSARDLVLLRTLANQGAIALRNAGSYAVLRELSESLERRVAERTAALARAHEELLSTQAHLARADKLASLGRLVAGIAHEINNPVAFVSSSVDLIRDGACALRERLGPDAEPAVAVMLDRLLRNADICLDGAQRAARIVRDLAAFSRTSQREPRPVDLNHALDRTLQLLRGETRDRIRVVREYGEVPHPEGIPGEIDQVLMNVVTNAVQALGDSGEIRLRTWAENGSVCIAVHDDGPGISPEIRERVFEPFFTTKDGQGTGLGLAISQALVERHGGDLALAGGPGTGTICTIRLPLAQARVVPEEATNDATGELR